MGHKRKSDGEQPELIEVGPKNAPEILRAAKAYKKAQTERTTALAEEIKQKQKLLAVVKAAKLQPTEEGDYHFTCNGATITVTPRDELVRVKFEDEADED